MKNKLICFVLIFTILISLNVNATNKEKILLLDIIYKERDFIIKDIKIKYGYFPNKLNLKGDYKYELVSDKVEYTGNFELPDKIFADYFENGKFTGKVIQLKEVNFTIVVPYIKNVKKIQFFKDNSIISSKNLPLYTETQAEIQATENCLTLIDNGVPENRLDIVYVADDYSESELTNFESDVIKSFNFLFSLAPFDINSRRINIRLVNLSSDLGCYYNCSGTDRLICCDYSAVMVAASECPFDEVVVLVNNDTYGGSGGTYAVSYNGYWMNEVVVHEFGHSFGELMDEYSYGGNSPFVPSGPNCDAEYSGNPNIACPKWAWAQGMPDIGCYIQCTYDNWYRPTYDDCIMYTLLARKFDVVDQRYVDNLLSVYSDHANIPLIQGWNLISIPLNLTNKTIGNVFGDINFSEIYTYENNSYTLLSLDAKLDMTMGYWVNANENTTLQLKGIPPKSLNFNLNQGYNLIGYPSINESSVGHIFEYVNHSINNILTYSNQSWLSYSFNKSRELNTVTNTVPGSAYFVDVKRNINWTFDGRFGEILTIILSNI